MVSRIVRGRGSSFASAVVGSSYLVEGSLGGLLLHGTKRKGQHLSSSKQGVKHVWNTYLLAATFIEGAHRAVELLDRDGHGGRVEQRQTRRGRITVSKGTTQRTNERMCDASKA